MHTIEKLERRQLLAATLTSNGTLNIRATSRDDVIRLGFDDTFVNTIAATINGEQRLFQGREVKRINLDALTGHDRIYVDRSLSGLGAIKLNIDTGKGDDYVSLEYLGQVKVTVDQPSQSDRLSVDPTTTIDRSAYVSGGTITMSTSSRFIGRPSIRLGIPLVGDNNGDIFIAGNGVFNSTHTISGDDLIDYLNNRLSPRPAIAHIDDSLLLAGYNAGEKNLNRHPDLSDNQLKKIKPGIISIDQSWEVTRVGTEGKIVWLKVRGDASRRNIELDTSIERTDGKAVDPSKYPAGVKERKLKVSFMAIHRDSLLAIGGLTGESAVPIAPSYVNSSGVVFASNAKLRLMNDWSDSHSVNDKIPLEPGVNPHGRRGVIVDDGIIWFDDVERPYFQKIDL